MNSTTAEEAFRRRKKVGKYLNKQQKAELVVLVMVAQFNTADAFDAAADTTHHTHNSQHRIVRIKYRIK